MLPFDYLAAEFPTKYSETAILQRMSVQLDLPLALVSSIVEEARAHNKEDGYHNFKHCLTAAAFCSDNYPRSRAHWFAMMFHDAHWSKTKDRHNVFASIYRAVKVLVKYPELGIEPDTVARLISYTCFEDGIFNVPESIHLSDYAIIHVADVYSSQAYDIWPAQYRGLADECGWPEDYATIRSHLNFILKDFDDLTGLALGSQLFLISAYIYQVNRALASVDLEIIQDARIAFIRDQGCMPNTVLIEEERFKRLGNNLKSRNLVDCRPTSNGGVRIMGMDVVYIAEGVKVGFVQ